MLRNHLHTYSSNSVNSIQYQIPFFKKRFKYIRLRLPKCQFIHKAANTMYTSYIIFFFFHIKYMSSSFICTSLTADRWDHALPHRACCHPRVQQHQGHRLSRSLFARCSLTADGAEAASAPVTTPYLCPGCGWR